MFLIFKTYTVRPNKPDFLPNRRAKTKYFYKKTPVSRPPSLSPNFAIKQKFRQGINSLSNRKSPRYQDSRTD
jgi:hypothetical protein